MMKLDVDEKLLQRGSRGLPNVHHINDTKMVKINYFCRTYNYIEYFR